MPHPQMFAEDDPYLARLRPLALRLPEAEEVISHGRPCFRVGRLFAVYGSGTKGPADVRVAYPRGLLVLPGDGERTALESDPRAFVPAYYAPSGWVGLDLAAGGTPPAEVDWTEVAELLEDSYRQVAPRRLLAELDGGTEHGS
jgi:hypothetical protein